jgi:hypothetical protein
MMRYSPSTNGFYPESINYNALPSDLVTITAQAHKALLDAQALGKVITAGVGGVPVAQDAVPDLAAWRASAKVSRFQAFAALSAAGKLTAATAAVNAAGGLAKLAWDNAIEFRRDSPTIASLAAAVGLDDAALDALFIAAAEIEA